MFEMKSGYIDGPVESYLPTPLVRLEGWVGRPSLNTPVTLEINGKTASNINLFERSELVAPEDGPLINGWSRWVDLANFIELNEASINVRLFVGTICVSERFFRLPNIAPVKRADPLFYFMHMPKTGGTTVRYRAIENMPPEKRVYVYETLPQYISMNEFHEVRDSSIANIDLIYGHFQHGLHHGKQRPYKYITILRNPYDFFLSMYFWHKYHIENEELTDFQDIFDVIENSDLVSFDNYACRAICGVIPGDRRVDAKDLAAACEIIDRDFAFIGLTESIQDSLSAISRITGIPVTVGRDRMNETIVPGERRNIDATKFRHAVWDRVKFDFAIYEYAKAKFWGDPCAAVTFEALKNTLIRSVSLVGNRGDRAIVGLEAPNRDVEEISGGKRTRAPH